MADFFYVANFRNIAQLQWRRTLVLKNSHELLASSCELLLEAHGSLLTASTVQECDATGDAICTKAR